MKNEKCNLKSDKNDRVSWYHLHLKNELKNHVSRSSIGLRLEDEKIIKDIRNLFRLKKEQNYTAIKDIRNLFRQEKETKAVKDRILRDIKNLSEHEKEENYYKPVRVSNFWSNNYIEYKCNGDRNKTLSVEWYLNKIKPYLKDIINNLTWKIQLTIANNFISFIDNDEEHVMHSKSDNIKSWNHD